MHRSLLFFLLLISTNAMAQTVIYVSDTLDAPLRKGVGINHGIDKMLPGGTPLTVVDPKAGQGYMKVQTDDGKIGWILDRYVMDQPSARQILGDARQALEALRTENASLQTQINQLAESKATIEAQAAETGGKTQELSQELANIRKTSANALAIDAQNKALQERMVELERELQLVQQENQSLTDRSSKDWFVIGALVLAGGVILGLLLPLLRPKRPDHYSDL